MRRNRSAGLLTLGVVATALTLFAGQQAAADKPVTHVSTSFAGAKVNKGTVTHTHGEKGMVLTLSSDFVVPDAPDPHWRVVDSKGTMYLLEKLSIKGDKVHTTITLPPYVKDVAKVQFWCAWAEVVLGEASFETPVS
jgi:hypothetical protein